MTPQQKIDAIVSMVGYALGELKGLKADGARCARAVLETIIAEHGPKREPATTSLPSSFSEGGILAQSYSHGQMIIERLERAKEHGD